LRRNAHATYDTDYSALQPLPLRYCSRTARVNGNDTESSLKVS
jgi:hypothetical protein